MSGEIDMSKFEGHTPGPWFAWVHDDDHPHIDVLSECITTAPPTFKNAVKADNDRNWAKEIEVLGSSEWLIAEAPDLHLMAAAPALLEEVKRLRAENEELRRRLG